FGLVYETVGFGIKAVLSLRAVTVRFCVSPRPAVIPDRLTVCGPALSVSSGAGFAIGFKVGAWLIGLTVTRKLRETALLVPPPLSVTVTVIVALPLAPATGTYDSVPDVSALL